MLLQILWMIATSAALLAASAAAFYTLCYLTLLLVGVFPMIGRRHRHQRWSELNAERVAPGRGFLAGLVASRRPLADLVASAFHLRQGSGGQVRRKKV